MQIRCFRLTYGKDLKQSIQAYCNQENIQAGCIISSVGCLNALNIRLSDGKTSLAIQKRFEICSLQGTISKNGCHLHISVSDDQGKMLGGHLLEGNLVNTTVEIMLLISEEYEFKREFDENTGYKELLINKL